MTVLHKAIKKYLVFLLLVLVISKVQTADIPCDYLIFRDSYEFKILNCTFTPDAQDYRLKIFYQVINDGLGAMANEIQYRILDKDFNRNNTFQKLQRVNHHLGQIVEGNYFLTRNLIKPDSALTIFLENADDWKIVIAMDSDPIKHSQFQQNNLNIQRLRKIIDQLKRSPNLPQLQVDGQ